MGALQLRSDFQGCCCGSVEQHFENIGRKAVNLLLETIEGNLEEPVHDEIKAELVIRGST